VPLAAVTEQFWRLVEFLDDEVRLLRCLRPAVVVKVEDAFPLLKLVALYEIAVNTLQPKAL